MNESTITIGSAVQFRSWHPDGPWVIGVVIDTFGRYSLVETPKYGVPMLVRTEKLVAL